MDDAKRGKPSGQRLDLSGPVATGDGPDSLPDAPALEGSARPRVVVLEVEQPDATPLREVLGEHFQVVAEVEDPGRCLELCRRLRPDLILVHLRLVGRPGLDVIQRLAAEDLHTLPVVIAPDRDLDLMRRAMQCGAREYLVEPLQRDDVVASLELLLRNAADEASELVAPTRPPGGGTWCFTSAVGGVGRTTLLLALADGLRENGLRVAVVDLNLFFGDLAFFLDLEPTGVGLADMARDFPRGPIPPLATLEYAQLHPSGLRVYLPPPSPADACSVSVERLIAVVRALEEVFEYVLVDMPAGVDEDLLPVLERARYVFVQGDDRLASVKNLVALVDLLGLIGIEEDRINPVLAQVHGDEDAPERFRAKLARLGTAPMITLPQDRLHVDDAVLGGEPVTRRSPQCPYAAAVREVVNELGASPRRRRAHRGARGGFLRRLLRRE